MTELKWGGATDVGRIREKNDDQFLLASPLFAVADGMGGARGGDVASNTAVEALKAAFNEGSDADALVAAVKAANRAVFEKAGSRDLRGMGTTITALALLPAPEDAKDGTGEEFAVVNVGDSRAYMLRDGELQQLTDDHNVPGELVRRGELTTEQAAVHPQRNLVTRVLGIEEDVEVDVWQLVPYAGDRLLLASDGLFGEVSDDDVATVLRTEADPDAASRKLVDMARDAGGHDNITVVIVDVVDDGGRAESASKALAGAKKGKGKGRSEADKIDSTEEVPVAAAPQADEILPESDDEPAPHRKRPSGVALLALFVVGMLIGGAAAAGAIWYGRSAWFLDTDAGEVVIFRGRPPDGFLWVEPEPVERTELDLTELPPDERDVVLSDTSYSSLGEARDQVARLERRAEAYREEREPPPTTTTTAPPPPPPPPPTPAPPPPPPGP
ncbi:MAG: protein phosphatase 2C domain-containing protein [Actinobacteria bacterium]|nr:protein phosphatase 2C domain-containing protein [Actinomycetota bacterium]